jgi:AcrR family transcriptional regulator
MRKQPEITEQTRQNILDAFWSLYAKKRIDQITVKEIAAKAGYNRGTFYEYFRDVRECLELIEARSLPRFDELPPLLNGASPSPGFVESFASAYREKYKYYDVLLGEKGDPSFHRKLVDNIKAAMMEAFPGKTGEEAVEIDLMLEYSVSGMISIMRYYSHSKPKRSVEEFTGMVYRIMSGDMADLMGGLAARAGGEPRRGRP